MNLAPEDTAFLDVLEYEPPAQQTRASISPLDRVPVEAFWEANQGPQILSNGYRSGGSGLGRLQIQSAVKSQKRDIRVDFHLNGFPFGCGLDAAEQRRAHLNSVDSAMSNADFPGSPVKLFTEPARAADPSPFNVHTLDFLNDMPVMPPDVTRSVRLKIATAPADIHTPPLSEPSRQASSRPLSAAERVPGASAGQPQPQGFAQLRARTGSLASSSSGTPPVSRPAVRTEIGLGGSVGGGGSGEGAPTVPERSMNLGEVWGGSLPSVGNSPGHTEDWANADVKRAFEKTNINPRKTEQNRRAQARFRQRKKDMFLEQQRQIQELNSRLEQAMREKKSYQEKTSVLQKMVEAKEKRIEALTSQSKEAAWLEELVDACWEFVLELKKGRQGLSQTREAVSDMVMAMLNWGAPALGFIRREVVEQLTVCLKQNGDKVDTPANMWLNDLVSAYERMVQRWGECRPQAFRSFLGLQLPEQMGLAADGEFWKKVLVSGGIRVDQRQQLAAARTSLITKVQQLVGRRRDIARLVHSGGPESALNQQPLLGNMAQAQHVLDLHAQILKEEQAAVFNFLTIIRLVLDPVQQAKLMVASFPFALDTLAVCSLIADEDNNYAALDSSRALLSQLPQESPFQALTPNAAVARAQA